MVVVKIELWPKGDQSAAKQIGEIRIALVASTDQGKTADYAVELRHAGRFWGRPGNWKTGKLLSHVRELSPYHLVMRAIAACVGR